MERSEREAILRLLRGFAGADGRIRSDQERVLEAASGKLGVAGPTYGDAIDISLEATYVTSPKAKVAAFEAAVAIAMVDGACSDDEGAMLEKIHALLEVDIPVSVAERAERWFKRLREARKRMADAEVDFLHRMTAGIGAGEYRALVADLHRARVAALRDELDPALEGRASYFNVDDATRDSAPAQPTFIRERSFATARPPPSAR